MTARYAVHTTATPDQVDWIGMVHGRKAQIAAEGDCFYGWGEPYDWRQGCVKHTVVYGLPLDEARWWARELTVRTHQVVVTEHDDWSIVVTDAKTPIHYRAEHEH